MLFSAPKQLPVVACTVCGGTGTRGARACSECRGMLRGVLHADIFYYLKERYTAYDITLRRGRRMLDMFRVIGGLVIMFGSWGLFAFLVYRSGSISSVYTTDFWMRGAGTLGAARILVWCGFLALLYVWYRLIVRNTPVPQLVYQARQLSTPEDADTEVERIGWSQVHSLPRGKREDISKYLTADTREALERATLLARSVGEPEVTILHLLHSLLSDDDIRGIGVRLMISTKSIQGVLSKKFQHTQTASTDVSPAFSSDVHNAIFRAYILTREYRDPYVRVTTLFKTAVEQSEVIQELLYDLEVDKVKLDNVIEWIRMRELLHEKYRMFRRAAAGVSKYGMDKAMTAVATPTLNQYSRDLTIAAKYGDIDTCVAREKEIKEVFRIIEGGGRNIILVGEHGVGKFTIVQGIVERMIRGEAPSLLQDKRLVQISTTSLLAGTTASGAQERLIRIMNEVSRAKNIILFINNIHDLIGVSDSAGQGLDVSESLAEYLRTGRFTMFATALPDAYTRHMVNSEIGTAFSKVDVREMDVNQTIRVLESRAGTIEYHNRVFFSYDALEKSAVFADKFFYDRYLPESAIALASESASFARSKHGERTLVTADDVGAIVAEKTGVPVTSITESESDKLLRLEEEMHTQVVGQSEAVALVANALRRARADMRSGTRPISSFLFLGPTGVGKTELAKTIARVYFGGEDRMIRVDMSEYQDKSSIYRLIGQPGAQGSGLLTESVHQHPFSLVLLDELEKADPDILNLFLQVFDDGRLTDSTGRVIDFTNTIIIATSNAGTAYVSERVGQGAHLADIKEELVRGELKQYYRPELLNRFDGIVLFKPLARGEIRQIAGLMLRRVSSDLERRGVVLEIEESALDTLADVGFDPEFGARPMRRVIQDRIENELANLILKGELQRRDTVIIGDNLSFRVEKAVR